MEFIEKNKIAIVAAIGILALAGLLLVASPVAHALTLPATPTLPMNQSVATGVPQLSLGSGTGSTSLAQSINCLVFRILGNAGVLPAGTDCGAQPPPPPGQGTLTVFKVVQGGSAVPANFTINVQQSGGSDSFPGSAAGVAVPVTVGSSYSVTENMNGIPNYTSAFSSGCSGTMPSGFRTCVVTNTFNGTTTPPSNASIRIIKVVNGGTATSSNFTVHLVNASSSEVSGSPQAGSASGTTYNNLAGGTYTVSETGGPSGYTPSFSGACNGNGSISLAASTSVTCTITNTFQQVAATSTLTVFKIVNGTSTAPSAFSIHVMNASSSEVSGSPQAGTSSGTMYSNLPFGTYRVSETGGPSGFNSVFSGDCNSSGSVSLSSSTPRTCTITNTWATSTPTTTRSVNIVKITSGGTASSSAFMIHLLNPNNDVSGSPQAGNASGTAYMNLPFGSYNVTETGGPSGYTAAFSGDCSSNGNLVLSANSPATSTCTLTNTFTGTTTGSITLFKVVNGGTASSSDFMLHLKNVASTTEVSGSPQPGTTTGTLYSNLAPGTYQIFETGAATSSYILSFSGACNQSGTLTLAASTSVNCTLTNTSASSTSVTDLNALIALLQQLLAQLRGQ